MTAELRKDLIREHWVAIATDRALKPNDFPSSKNNNSPTKGASGFCPFCEGNEACTPPEKDSVRTNSAPNTPGWSIRVTPNKFSAFEPEGEVLPSQKGIYPYMNSYGIHEVIIETSDHDKGWTDYSEEEVLQLLLMYQKRFKSVASDEPNVKYIQLYKNFGLYAGASLAHNHSQLIGFPVIPNSFNGFNTYYKNTEHCLMCDILKEDANSPERIIYEGKFFILVCPYASRYSYEAWLIPKEHQAYFCDISEDATREMAKILHAYVPHMYKTLNNAAFNLLINCGPVNTKAEEHHFNHWYMEILPRMIIPAGVESKTDIYINPVAPEFAAQVLKEGFEI